MRKYILFITLLIALSNIALYAYDTSQEAEVLKKIIAAPNDSTKLKLLDELSVITQDDQAKSTQYINALIDEASKQNNSYYICKGYLAHIANSFNMYDVEAVNKWVALLEPVARHAKLYDFMFQGRRAAIDILNLNGDYELVEKRAYQMINEAQQLNSDMGVVLGYQSLGYVYAFSYRYDQSTAAFQEAYVLSNKLNNVVISSEILDRLIETYTIQGNYKKRLEAIRNHEMLAKKFKHTSNNEFLLSYIHYLNYYLDTKNLNEAEKYMILCDKYFTKGVSVFEELYHKACYRYYNLKGEYKLAITEVDTLISISSNEINNNSHQFTKANLYVKLGNYNEALSIYKRAWPIKDSLQIAILHQQVNQLRKDYDADTLLLEQENINIKTRIALVILIITGTLILVVFMIHTLRTQRVLGVAEKEQRQLNYDMNLTHMAKEHFITNISSAISVPLNSVLDNSSLLATNESLSKEQRKEISQNVVETSNELMKLINNILDLSRLEAKMMKYKIARIEITSTIKDTISIMIDSGVKVTGYLSRKNLIWINVDNNSFVKLLKNIIGTTKTTSEEVSVIVHEDFINNGVLKIVISGSALDIVNPPHEIIIVNEINNMIINDFNGKYEIFHDKEIVITLPIIKIERIQ